MVSDGGEFLSRMTSLINCRGLDHRWTLPQEVRLFQMYWGDGKRIAHGTGETGI